MKTCLVNNTVENDKDPKYGSVFDSLLVILMIMIYSQTFYELLINCIFGCVIDIIVLKVAEILKNVSLIFSPNFTKS